MTDWQLADLPPDVRAHRPRCPGCTPETLADETARPCSFYSCPGLPESLRVTCELCMFDFSTNEGQVKCDHDACERAHELKANVPVYEAWRAMVTAQAN